MISDPLAVPFDLLDERQGAARIILGDVVAYGEQVQAGFFRHPPSAMRL